MQTCCEVSIVKDKCYSYGAFKYIVALSILSFALFQDVKLYRKGMSCFFLIFFQSQIGWWSTIIMNLKADADAEARDTKIYGKDQ